MLACHAGACGHGVCARAELCAAAAAGAHACAPAHGRHGCAGVIRRAGASAIHVWVRTRSKRRLACVTAHRAQAAGIGPRAHEVGVALRAAGDARCFCCRLLGGKGIAPWIHGIPHRSQRRHARSPSRSLDCWAPPCAKQLRRAHFQICRVSTAEVTLPWLRRRPCWCARLRRRRRWRRRRS